MNKLSLEDSQSQWIQFIVDRIADNIVYGKTLGTMPVLSYEEWVNPDMYYTNGVDKAELPKRYKGEEYLHHQIETFQEWFRKDNKRPDGPSVHLQRSMRV